mmetsp:Transcript_123756/g.240802  ORF Transcript_123756/g.240802 Transcript_123756/m.240802 type:complete len:159 (-) Transcript_123756:71-547(-)
MPQSVCPSHRLHSRKAGLLAFVAATLLLVLPNLPSSGLATAIPSDANGNYAIRVCDKCIQRRAGGGYNPRRVLEQTARGAASAGWPAPRIQGGGCLGGCELGPNVRLVKGEYAIPVVVDGMTEEEADYKAFVLVTDDAAAERVFGLSSRAIMEDQQAE